LKFLSAQDWQYEGECRVELSLGPQAAMHMSAIVAHHESGQAGLQWTNLDLDSVTHLRHLLELNVKSAGDLSRELSLLPADRCITPGEDGSTH